ncbi:unnamed protein product [Cuscuta epithymum]|uniref:Uncharacterized protein n=1 Tax=Cuscuta epithymum TaxID=186058 RepID=A0AAV0D7V4_9ASTE|nr:unnamed protein product [Cuscuta epithymum]
MYPKVKVRDQEEGDDDRWYAYGLGSLESLKAFEAISLSVLSSSDDSPTSVVRIPTSYMSSSPKPPTPLPTEATSTKSEKTSSGRETTMRASLVPRPRAVLSSPDNDQIIGSSNKGRARLRPSLRNQNVCQSRGVQCKTIPRTNKVGTPLKAKDVKSPDDGETGLRNQNVCQSRGVQCKTIPRTNKAGSPLKAKDVKSPDDGETGIQIKGRTVRRDQSKLGEGTTSARIKGLG